MIDFNIQRSQNIFYCISWYFLTNKSKSFLIRKIDLKITETELCEALILGSLENITQQFFVIGEQHTEEASIGGIWGVFFAIPLATLIKAIYSAWPNLDEAQKPESVEPSG